MDPKLSNLDPKLKEAYERVMGNSNTPPTPPPPPVANPNPQATPVIPPPPPVEPPPPSPGVPESSSETVHIGPTEPSAMPPSPPPPPMPETQTSGSETVHIGPAETAVMPPPTPTEAIKPYPSQVLKTERGSRISPIIIGLLVMVFLISYTFLWVRVFNLKIPFLP